MVHLKAMYKTKTTYTTVIIIIIAYNCPFSTADVNECLKIECLNNATCVNRDGSYQCDCLPGYMGQFCGEGRYQKTNYLHPFDFFLKEK